MQWTKYAAYKQRFQITSELPEAKAKFHTLGILSLLHPTTTNHLQEESPLPEIK